MELREILQNILISVPFIAAGAWVVREIFRLFLDRDLEKFKADLAKESASFKIRYEKLHGERMEVIKNTYQKLVRADTCFRSLVGFSQTDDGKRRMREEQATAALMDFTAYFNNNKIFFEDVLAQEIQTIISSYNDLYFEYIFDAPPDTREEWQRNWNTLNSLVRDTMRTLEDRFRSVIGIEN